MVALKAIIYTRVSTDKQADEGTGLEVQESACLRKAQELNAEVVDIISDEGVSGAFYVSRPGIQKALALLETKQADTLITMKLDRSGRDADVLAVIRKRVQNAGAQIVFVDGANFENNATGNLLFRVNAGFVEYEKEVIRERMMGGRRRKAQNGEQVQRSRPAYGYIVPTKSDVIKGTYPAEKLGKYLLDPATSHHAREIFRLVAGGMSLMGVCRELESRGIASASGAVIWYPETVSNMVQNPVYKGVGVVGRVLHKTFDEPGRRGAERRKEISLRPESEWITFDAPALVDMGTWNLCQERMAENKRLLSGRPTNRYLLSGLLVCPVCGVNMCGLASSSGNGRTYLYYRSGNRQNNSCHCKQIRADKVDKAVTDAILTVSRQPRLFKAALEAYEQSQAARPSVGETDAEQAQLQAELSGLAKQEQATVTAQIAGIAAGASADAYDAAFHAIRDKRKRLETRLKAITPVPVPTQSVAPVSRAEKWEKVLADVETALTSPEITRAERHGLIALVVRKIVPGADGLTLYFRDGVFVDTINTVEVGKSVKGSKTLTAKTVKPTPK